MKGWVMLCGALCLLLCGCGTLTGTPSAESGCSGRLTMTGSTAMAQVCQALGEGFARQYPGVTVEKSGIGSGEAAEAVRSGRAMLGDLSRPLTPEENPADFTVTALAQDVVVFIVSAEQTVQSLRKEQLRGIFSGEIQNWSQVGGQDLPIVLIGREASSGTRAAVEQLLDCGAAAYRCAFSSAGEVAARVGQDSCAIGYCSMTALHDGVRALAVDGVSPSLETAENGSYPYQMPLLQIYRKGVSSPLLTAWFSYVKSEQGQAVIRKCGLLPAA